MSEARSRPACSRFCTWCAREDFVFAFFGPEEEISLRPVPAPPAAAPCATAASPATSTPLILSDVHRERPSVLIGFPRRPGPLAFAGISIKKVNVLDNACNWGS